MLIKNKMLVTNMEMKETKDRIPYATVGLLGMDDGQKFDVSIRDEKIHKSLQPMQIYDLAMQLSNTQYGMKLQVLQVVSNGTAILQTKAN